jgi:hypothetical protein
MALCFYVMRSRVLIAAVLSVAGVARAEDRPRSIWLECKPPAVWPPRSTAPVHLVCRVEPSGPAFWQTVNPFTVQRASELMDPFEANPIAVDVIETNHRARPRPAPARLVDPFDVDELISPFEVYPDPSETLNPFDPPRRQSARPAR